MSDPAIRSSVDRREVEKFSAAAAEWWDANGRFRPLHRLNPIRLAFIREKVLAHFGLDPDTRAPFAGLRLLDIGCGGGLLCEPMARLGFSVTGADPSEINIEAGRAHASVTGLAIDYRATAIEDIAVPAETPFHVILNMEVVEHAASPRALVEHCVRLLAPGGLMIVSTLNRTLKSLALAKIAAEYVLRWTAPGSHDWRRFLLPSELRDHMARAGCDPEGPFGVEFDIVAGRWKLSGDSRVNYFMTGSKPPASAL
jgi:2-polyprenyl-6-hydroxyphenyl methylase/3-demethylubiquinone-9 3-methyltransferase